MCDLHEFEEMIELSDEEFIDKNWWRDANPELDYDMHDIADFEEVKIQ